MIIRMLLLLFAIAFSACDTPPHGVDPKYCSTWDLDRGVVFRFDPTFVKWIAPHKTTDLWDAARALAPLAFNDSLSGNPIVFTVKMAWLDLDGNIERECMAAQNQAYTHVGELSIYVCNWLVDSIDGAGADPWLGGHGYGMRARLLAHEAMHGLACRPDHLKAQEQGIMCGVPYAPAVSCSKGLKAFTDDDRAYGCGQWVSGGFCERDIPPMEPEAEMARSRSLMHGTRHASNPILG